MTTGASSLRARDVMAAQPLVVTADTPILDVHRLFLDRMIHGAPVIDDDDRVCGVISTVDLLRAIGGDHSAPAPTTRSTFYADELPYAGPDWLYLPDDLQERVDRLTAGDAMTRDVIHVGPDASLADVARLMIEHRIQRVLVLDGGELRGVVTTYDVLRGIVAASTAAAPAIEPTGYRK